MTDQGAAASRRYVRSRTYAPSLSVLLALTAAWIVALWWLPSWTGQAVLFFDTLGLLAVATGRCGSVWTLLRIGVPLWFVFTIVNALLAPASGQLLWQGPTIWALGPVRLTTGSIALSVHRALRLWSLVTLLFVIGRLVRPEHVVRAVGRGFGGTAITLAMVLRFIPGLLEERQRIAHMQAVHGLRQSGSRWVRAKSGTVIYLTLLQNALERAWQLAESMFVRGYGARHRSAYPTARRRQADRMWLLALSAWCVCQVAWWILPSVLGSWPSAVRGLAVWLDLVCATGTVLGLGVMRRG